MPEELFEKVLEALQPDGPSKPHRMEAWGSPRRYTLVAAVRLVCAGWKAVHDAMVRRLALPVSGRALRGPRVGRRRRVEKRTLFHAAGERSVVEAGRQMRGGITFG